MLILLVLTVVIAALILHYACKSRLHGILESIAITFSVAILIASGVAAVVCSFRGWDWIASEHKTTIINRTYGTNYTREEIFWAGNVIEEIRELERKRIEINGNVLRDTDK